jgi:hypothetical protein
VPGFSTAEDVGVRNRTAGDERDTAPDGTTYRRSGPQLPRPVVATERAGGQPAAGADVAIRPKLHALNAACGGSTKLTGVAG